jgi:hypothetical protein
MSLGTLTEQFYLKDDLQYGPAQVTHLRMKCWCDKLGTQLLIWQSVEDIS